MKAKFLVFLIFLVIHHVDVRGQKKPVVHPLSSFSLDSDTRWAQRIFDTRISDNVQCVGLGEVLHGGKEITQAKAKIVQYLVEKRGYRAFLFEYPNAALSLLNYYLQEKKLHSPDTLKMIATNALKGSVYQFDTSFINLLIWLKHFNLKHPTDHIAVKGVDITGASGAFSDYFMHNFSALLDSNTRHYIDKNRNKIPIDSITQTLLSRISKNRDSLRLKLKKYYADLYYNEQNARLAIQHSRLKKTHFYHASFFRDSAMAKNVEKVSENKKSIFWAYNGHVSPYSNYGAGKILKEAYKADYYTILTDFSGHAKILVRDSTGMKMKTFYPNPSVLAYRLSKLFKVKEGVVFYAEIPNKRKISPRAEGIDNHGNYQIIGKRGFDALVILKDITSVVPEK